MIYYTYIYYDPSKNNEPIYVGKGHDDRVWHHLTRLTNSPLYYRLRKMKKNGINPIIGIYAELDEEFAHFLEEELISKFGRKDLGRGTLLNLTDGGEGLSGYIHRTDSKNKMSKSRLGNKNGTGGKGKSKPLLSEAHKKAISQSQLGKINSEETKDKMSKSKTGKSFKLSICPHCNKSGGINNMKRWHFENCKNVIDAV